MAQLPPDGTWLLQQIGDDVVLFHRHTEEELVRYPVLDADATAKAQKVIHQLNELDEEQASMAHFWCGYFYGCSRA